MLIPFSHYRAAAGGVVGPDVDSLSYSGLGFSVSTENGGNSFGTTKVSRDGNWVHVLNRGDDVLYQYAVTTTGVLTAGSYDTSFDPTETNGAESDFCFSHDGTKLYMLDGADIVYAYTCSTPWDVDTASYDSDSLDVVDAQSRAIEISSDGLVFYHFEAGASGGRLITQWDLSPAYDISTGSTNGTYNLVDNATFGSIAFDASGTRLYFINNSEDIEQHNLTVAWDITTASNTGNALSLSGVGDAYGISISADGTEMYVGRYDDGGSNTYFEIYTL